MGTKANAREEFVRHLIESLHDKSFVRLVLSRSLHPSDNPEKVIGRLVDLKAGPHLSLTLRYPTHDTTKNIALDHAADWVEEYIGAKFRSVLLNTTKRDWQLFVGDAGAAQLVAHKASHPEAPSREHDKPRQTILDDSARDWLRGLDILNERGNVRPAMADKYTQINRYLEIFTHLTKECGWADRNALNDSPTIADMGCGKGYLTFGVWHLFARVWKRPAKVIGVEVRKDLMDSANTLAQRIGAQGLEFAAGTIKSAELPTINALVALHACNTATDEAIRRGIEAQAQLIIVAPCCHKEVRHQLVPPTPLAPVLEHGIMAERMSEWATDGLRALFLEWAGYHTKMIEFVSTEHTPKNLMIAAVLTGKPSVSNRARERIEQFKEFFGIKHHALDTLLLHELGEH